MSGGGGSKSWTETGRPGSTETSAGGGGGSGGPGVDKCDIISVTNLNSPNPAVVGSLRPGDTLLVQLQSGPPRLLLAVTAAGQIAGSITSAEMARIIACIQRGEVYMADVVSVRGGICQVRIHR